MYRVSIPLTLGVPNRPDPQALITGLLQQRCRSAEGLEARFVDVSSGPPIVAASIVKSLPAGSDLGRIVIDLDIDPEELRDAGGATYEAVRFHVNVDADTLADAIGLRLPSPLVIFPDLSDASAPDSADASVMETLTTIVEGHRTPGFAASAAPRHIADILAVVAHAEVGFVAQAADGREALSILAATVAALRGDDILKALSAPDLAALAVLRPEAADATRTVLLGIEVDDASSVHRDLTAAGLIRALSADGRSVAT